METAAVEKVDSCDSWPDVSVEETPTPTTICVNGVDDIVRNDEPDVSDASEEDDNESIDSSFHTPTSFTLTPPPETQKRTCALPFPPHHRFSNQTQVAPKLTPSLRHAGRRVGSSDARVMYAGRYLRGVGRLDDTRRVAIQKETQGGDVHSFDEVGLFYLTDPFLHELMPVRRPDALQQHWDKYCRRPSKRLLERQTTALRAECDECGGG